MSFDKVISEACLVCGVGVCFCLCCGFDELNCASTCNRLDAIVHRHRGLLEFE